MENPLSRFRGAAKRPPNGTRLSGLMGASDFDDFLAAPIGEERNGPISVMSMFGRLGIDPRREAFDLAALSKTGAIRRLAASIDQLAAQTESAVEAETIAALAIARLPRRAIAAPQAGAPAAGSQRPRTVKPWMLLLAAGVAILIGQTLYSANGASPLVAAPETAAQSLP